MATDLDISVPCRAAAGLDGPGKTVLLSTVPKQAPEGGRPRPADPARNDDLVVVVRNPVVVAPLSQVLSPACQRLTFVAHADEVTAEFVGLTKGADSDDPGAALKGRRGG